MCNMLRNLLASADPEECARHSFDHYHARGLRYINLLRTERLTAKLYIARPGKISLNPDGYVVNPHSHGYNFETYVVRGQMKNVLFGRGHERWFGHRYVSLMKGASLCEPLGNVGIGVKGVLTLREGDSYYLDTEEVHTIWVPSDQMTVLFLLQYHDHARRDTVLFTREPTMPNLDGLYGRLAPDEVAEDLRMVSNNVRPLERRGWVSQMLGARDDGDDKVES